MRPDDLTVEAGKTARGGAFLFFGNALSTVVLAVGSIVIARLLGPPRYGLYSLTLVTPLILVGLADAGMSFVLVREPARLRSRGDYRGAEKSIKFGLTVKVCISTIAAIICFVGADPIALFVLNRPELSSVLRLASLIIVFQALLDAASGAFVGLELMNYNACMQVLYSILKSALAPMLILIGFGLTGAVSGNVLGLLVAGITATIILFMKLRGWSVAETSGSPKVSVDALLRYCLPLYSASLLMMFLTQYRNIVLAHFASNTEIGNFNAAFNFNVLFVILTYPITVALFPMFSKMDPVSQRCEVIKAFELATRYTSLVILPTSVAFMLFSRDLVYLTYGKSYVLAPYYLTLFSAIWFVAAIGNGGLGSGGTISSFLLGTGDTRTIFIMNALILALFIPIGPILTWYWGVYGLLIALIISNVLPAIYGVYGASVRIGERLPLRGNVKILVAAIASALPIIALLQFHLAGAGIWQTLADFIGGGLIYTITYLTLAPAIGAVSRLDVEKLKTIFDNVPIIGTLAKPVFIYETRILSALGGLRHELLC